LTFSGFGRKDVKDECQTLLLSKGLCFMKEDYFYTSNFCFEASKSNFGDFTLISKGEA